MNEISSRYLPLEERLNLILPRIHDGAWLGWFDRIGTGTSRTVTWFGNFVFAWG